jgi:DNA-binding PadR family transcriptional regulator
MSEPKRSPLALAILVLLYEEPMHVYRMQQLIKERGKDEVINVTQRNSLYQMIARLERDGLLAERSVDRENKRPEKTIYELTEAGRSTTIAWMREYLSTPSREFPDFPAAVSMLAVLTPKDATTQFERRIKALEAQLARLDGQVAEASTFVPRLFLLEAEYVRAQMVSEITWVRAVVKDLRAERLTWNRSWLRKMAKELGEQHGDSGKGE